MDLIIGSADQRIDKAWISALPRTGLNVHVVKGANHFFDQEHEFDLQELVEEMLLEN